MVESLDSAFQYLRELETDVEATRQTGLLTFARLKIPLDDYIGFVPTPMKVVRRMLQLAEIEKGDTVYDLGCGDGRVLITAVKDYGARGVGIDIDGDRLEEARRRAKAHLKRIVFRQQNVFKTDLRAADVVTLYLLPSLNAKLLPRLAKLRRGVRIVSHDFELPDVIPFQVSRLPGVTGRTHRIFAYRTPLRTE
jgi:SAM-dependent methyltransferase